MTEAAYELVEGSIWEVVQLGEHVVRIEKGKVSRLIEDSRLFTRLLDEHLFFCDQCGYFAENAAAVQEHNEREHDCQLETYKTLDTSGAKHLRVRTVKCHPRATIRPSKSTEAWEGLRH